MATLKQTPPVGRLADTEEAEHSEQVVHFHKGLSSSFGPPPSKSTNRNTIPRNYSRNRTVTSTSLPSNASIASAVSSDRHVTRKFESPRSSSINVTCGPERQKNLAKTLLARGSKLWKNRNSRADSTSLRTLEWLEKSEISMGKLRSQRIGLHLDGRHERAHSTCTDLHSRHISEPYNFQHLTHTYANQFQKLEKTSHSELVSEFSAIRASQIPCRDLRGIKADSLPHRNSLLEVPSGLSSPNRSQHSITPPLSPRTHDHQRLNSSQTSLGSLPSPRRAENFSQPSPKMYKPRPSPITPPPRGSSKNLVTDMLSARLKSSQSPSDSLVFGSGSAPIAKSPLGSGTPTSTAVDWQEDLFDYATAPHAVSTPNETAFALKLMPCGNVGKELPNLPKEAETPTPKKLPNPSSSQPTFRPSLRHAKSYPSTKSSSRRWSLTSSRVSPDGLISPLVDGPPLAEAVLPSVDQPLDDIPFRPRLSRQISGVLPKNEDCWEDDIDYCYEHAAEADCDFDWDRISSEDGKTDVPMDYRDPESDQPLHNHNLNRNNVGDASSQMGNSLPGSVSSTPYYFPPLQVSRSESNLSSRDSSKSSTLSIASPVTPSQSLVMPLSMNLQSRTAKDSSLGPLFISRDFDSQFLQDDLYQRLLAGEHVLDHIYPFRTENLDTSSCQDDSPRSSHSQISKYASQENFSRTSPTSICHHRDSESVASLPELVHSRWNSQSSDLTTNRIGHGVAPVPSAFPDKPLPPKPKPNEMFKAEMAPQFMIHSQEKCNQSSGGMHNDNTTALYPRVALKHDATRPLSFAARGDLQPSADGALLPRRSRSSNAICIVPTDDLTGRQVVPSLVLSIPF